jgi:hypothetical protein
MNRWITDRAPEHDEIDNRDNHWIVVDGKVDQASGWWIKTSWGKRPELTAWEPKPTAEIARDER